MGPKWQFCGLIVLLLALSILVGLESKSLASATVLPAVAFVRTIIFIIGCFMVTGKLMGDPRGVLIDQRGRISLSRLQLVIWSVLVIAAITTEGIVNVFWGVQAPLELSVPPEMWVLLGLSSITAVAAPIVLGTKGNDLFTKALDIKPAWRDIFFGDDNGNCDKLDFSNVQQFFLTVALVAVYAAAVIVLLSTNLPSKILTFPPLDPGFVGIMAVSQSAYIAYKALPQGQTDQPLTQNPSPGTGS